MVILLLLACAGDPEPPVSLPGLDARQLLVRSSIDLRGVRPSVDELDAVGEDLEVAVDMATAMLDDPRWGAQVRDLFGYAWLTRTEGYFVLAQELGFGGDGDIGPFTASFGDEVLRSISTIAEQDLPWTEVVTADWTMANEYLGASLPVDYDAGAGGWQQVTHTDGRPAAGVLAASTLWIRYSSTTSNANRGRANAISRMLLCADYLEREIAFDRTVNLIDEEATLAAIQTNPGCTACHSSLDPLASHLYGFLHLLDDAAIELTSYHPEREGWWDEFTGTPPGYYGTPTQDLVDLGWAIAKDPRLRSCAVERVYEGLLQRESDVDDTLELLTHLSAFEVGGLTLRSLYGSLLGSGVYQGVGAQGVMAKMLRPEQYASIVEELTGYRLTFYDYDLLQSDLIGIRTLAGGVNGISVTVPARTPNVTTALAQERIAEAAAWTVVGAGGGDLIATVIATDAETVAAQIEVLHRRILSQPAGSDDAAATVALFGAILSSTGDAEAAWAGVISALLRDPEFLFF